MEMIKNVLKDNNMFNEKIDVMPFRANSPEQARNYSPSDAIFYIGMLDNLRNEKFKLLRNAGCSIEFIWTESQRNPLNKQPGE